MSSEPAAAAKPQRPLLMIPGPIEFSPEVLAKLGEPTPGHVSAGFLAEFGEALELLREVFVSPAGQPIVLSGSGTLGWELVAANLVESSRGTEGADVIVVNTGYFSDSWADCFEAFGLKVAQVKASAIGGTVSPEALTDALRANPHVQLVALTQVDTSTAVLNDIASLSAAVKAVRPEILVAVDGVCSFGGEEFRQDSWGVDAALTCSQKALGVPPGLMVAMLSPLALKAIEGRKTRVPTYYANVNNWLPIMRAYEARKPSYFATPNVNLIRSLTVSLRQIVAAGVEKRWAQHSSASDAFKAALDALGLKQVPTAAAHSAHTLSAIRFPTTAGFDASKLLPALVGEGIVAAGGLHKEIKAEYFRVGHMSLSVSDKDAAHVEKVVRALEVALKTAGYTGFKEGAGIEAFQTTLKQRRQ